MVWYAMVHKGYTFWSKVAGWFFAVTDQSLRGRSLTKTTYYDVTAGL